MSDDITSDVADVLQMFSPFKATRRGPGVSRSGHAALKVQRGVFAQFLEASFTFLLSSFLLHSKSRSSRDLPEVRAEDRLEAVASKSHSTEVIPTILASGCAFETHIIQ